VSVLTPSFSGQRQRNLGTTLISAGVVIALLYYGRDFFVTLITGVTIAFLLEPFVSFLVGFRLPRALASFLVCTAALLALYLAGLGLYTQVVDLMDDLPRYGQRITELVDSVALRLESAEQSAYQILIPKRIRDRQSPKQNQEPPPVLKPSTSPRRRSAEPPTPLAQPQVQEVRIKYESQTLFDYLYERLPSFYKIFLLASFVPFLVYFMLSWSDHIRRSYLHLFRGEDRHAAGRSWQGIADMARAYVVGNFVLGVLLSIVSGLFFWAVKLPYFLLVGPLSAFLSLVPYVGLPLAMLPPFFVGLPVYRGLTAYLIIGAVVGFLHLIALNALYPKLVGSRVHLNPLAVTIALMFWGVLWGAIGLVFAIPITAGIKAVCDNVADLQPYGRLLGD
jgi:predicted PurR-regulated permease PerM